MRYFFLVLLLVIHFAVVAQSAGFFGAEVGFSAFANHHDIIISEVMTDPTPQVQLPEAEFIELLNRKQTGFVLDKYYFIINGKKVTFKKGLIAGYERVIVCHDNDSLLFAPYGKVIPIAGFPNLSKTSLSLELRNPLGRLIHYQYLSSDWFSTEFKRSGGWTLEIIDPNKACWGIENWRECENPMGGTPGQINSNEGSITERFITEINRVAPVNDTILQVEFSQRMDSASLVHVHNFKIIPDDVTVKSARLLSPVYVILELTLEKPLKKQVDYQLQSIRTLVDCQLQTVNTAESYSFGLPENPDSLDIIMNEILFDPEIQQSEFIELWNRSGSWVDVSELGIRYSNTPGKSADDDTMCLAERPFLLAPDGYLVVAQDTEVLLQAFRGQLSMQNTLMPAKWKVLPNNGKTLTLFKKGTGVMDVAIYQPLMHSSLLNTTKGVSLERVDPDVSGIMPENWASAAAHVGYATPAMENSQLQYRQSQGCSFSLITKVVTPNADGADDEMLVNYLIDSPGFAASAWVFDVNGNLVNRFLNNALLGASGQFSWDAKGQDGRKLPSGYYILLVEAFHPDGRRQQYKVSFVIGYP